MKARSRTVSNLCTARTIMGLFSKARDPLGVNALLLVTTITETHPRFPRIDRSSEILGLRREDEAKVRVERRTLSLSVQGIKPNLLVMSLAHLYL